MNAPFSLPSDEIIVDSFAGGGGTSEGIRQAVGRDPDIAINHDRLALAMHRINHPGTHHEVEDVWHVDALGMCDGRPIGLLWLSPDCKHFSKAKGGKPREKAIRGLAWVGVRWVKSLPKRQRPRVVILENVEEFQWWGPLLDDGKPCPVQKGATFKAFIGAFQALGYVAEWRELRACDYGDPTIRKRLFVILRNDGAPIVWPVRTHGNPKDPADAALIAAGVLKPWRTAAEIIDFTLPCPSIFETSAEIKATLGLRAIRPLADNTMARVAKGTMRYVLNAPKPFLVKVNHTGRGEARSQDVEQPVMTMTGARGEALVMPFVSYAQQGGGIRDVTDPLHTLTASVKDQNLVIAPFVTKFNRGATGHAMDQPLATVTSHASETHGGGAAPLGLVAPILINVANSKTTGRGPNAWPADEPARTITTAGGQAVVAPILIGCGGRAGQSEPRPADEPVLTQTAKPDACLVAPIIVRVDQTSGDAARKGVYAADDPLRTITTAGSQALVAPFLVPRYQEKAGQGPRLRGVDEPAATIMPRGNEGVLAAVHLVKNNHGDKPCAGADAPLHTVTTQGNRFAVVASFLVPRYGERPRQEPRTRAVDEPAPVIIPTGNEGSLAAVHLARHFGASVGGAADEPAPTVTAGGAGKTAVVAAFLAQHNTDQGDGIKPGRPVSEPISTITAAGSNQSIVQATFLSHAYTSNTCGGNGDLERPLKTTLAGGQHAALVAAFLAKYYGAGEPVQAADDPLHTVTVTAKPRHGLVTVALAGEPYVITDIGMRMLTPRERFSAQGFRPDYVIDYGVLEDGSRVEFTLEQQGRMCGNSVCPGMARALVAANYAPAARPRAAPARAVPLLDFEEVATR